MTARAEQYEELDPETRERWLTFAREREHERPYFAQHLGLVVDEVRTDYCRMRLVFQPALLQGGGIIHGGAIASLLDTVLVPAIGSTLPPDSRFATVDLHVQFMEALREDDAVAEGWVVRRGRRTVFGQSEARAASTGRLIATSLLTYAVSPPPAP